MAQVLEQTKSCLRDGSARFLHALNPNTALLNISFSLSGSRPKYRSFVSVVKEESDINFAERERERERESACVCVRVFACVCEYERTRARIKKILFFLLWFL